MKRTLLIYSIFSLLGLVGLAAFYAPYEILSNKPEQQGYTGQAANAVKHAYAAGQLYQTLRTVMEPDTAQNTVLTLGLLNEYAEKITKFSNPDSVSEVMKDFYNNQAGITAAHWHAENKIDKPFLETILRLGDDTLLNARDQNPFVSEATDPAYQDIPAARVWFEAHAPQIQARVLKSLQSE